MKVDEILFAISRFRQDKRTRSKSPISLLQESSKSPLRTVSPINKLESFASKSRRQQEIFLQTFRPPPIMAYKKDAASLMVDTLQKFKKRMFRLFENNLTIRGTLEISFTKSFVSPLKTRLAKEKVFEEKEFYLSPSFNNHPKINFGGMNRVGEGLTIIFEVFRKRIEEIKRFVMIQISRKCLNNQKILKKEEGLKNHHFQAGRNIPDFFDKDLQSLNRAKVLLEKNVETSKKDMQDFSKQLRKEEKSLKIAENSKKTKEQQESIEKMIKILTLVYRRQIMKRLMKRDAYHKRTWELPLKLDLRNLSQKSEIIDFSSVDQSEVLFEATDNSFTNRFQNSVDKQSKELTLSSIISNEDRQNTERVFKTRFANKTLVLKPAYELSDSLSDSKLIKPNKFQFGKNLSSHRPMQKPLGMMSFIIENNLKSHAFHIFSFALYNENIEKILKKIMKNACFRLKHLLNVIKRMKNLPRILKGLDFIYRNKCLIGVAKKFMILKNVERMKKNLKNFQVLQKIFNLGRKKVFHAFLSIKNLEVRKRVLKAAAFAIGHSLKRAVKVVRVKRIQFGFNILSIVYQEFLIKFTSVSKIVRNVGKDIKFRISVCFEFWKKNIESQESQYLQGLSFIQLITELFESKKRYAFNVLSYYERSFLNLSYT
jgi:hypothetical protein